MTEKDRKGLLDAVDELTERRKKRKEDGKDDEGTPSKKGKDDLDLDSIWS